MKRVAEASVESAGYAMKANRIAVRDELGRVVAIIEVVSPGNKDSRNAVASFVSKAVELLRNGIHFLMVDPFPVGPRDPDGIAKAVWDALCDTPLGLRPADRPFTVASFDAGDPLTA